MKRSNLLQDNDAPGETRTPNLLIRSQSLIRGLVGSGRFQRLMPAVQTAKGDSKSHNISHNTSENQGGRYGSVAMRKRTACPPTSQQPNHTVPDLYADSKIFLAWRFAA